MEKTQKPTTTNVDTIERPTDSMCTYQFINLEWRLIPFDFLRVKCKGLLLIPIYRWVMLKVPWVQTRRAS
jgi:hypothetical protein